MNIKNPFLDVHLYFIITLTTITILLFNVFDFLGLIIYGFLIIYGLIFIIVNYKSKPILKTPSFYILSAYYIYSFLALCVNGSLFRRGSAILQLFMLSIIAFFIRPNQEIEKDIKSLSKMMTVASIIMGATSIGITLFTYYNPEIVPIFPAYIQNVFLKTMGECPRRMAGIATHPNYTAEFCLVGTMLSFYLITTEKSRKWKTFSLLNIIISFFIIFIATSSRTSMVCMLFFTCAFLCFYFYSNRKDAKIVKRMKYILFCLLFIALICIILFFISDSFKKFVNEHVLRVSSLKTASGRDSVYKVAFELGKGHRIFGYNDQELSNRIASHAHNMYLQLLSFAGIPGLVLYCIYFFYTIYLAIKNFFNNVFNSSEKVLNCLFLSYLTCYILYGIPEDAGVNWIKAISVYAQIIFAFIHILNYNVKLKEQRISVDSTM